MYRLCAVVVALVVLSSAAATAQTRTVRLSEPVTGPESPIFPGGFSGLWLSADGAIAIFASDRATLVPGDTNRSSMHYGTDVFIRDIAAGTTRRILGVGGQQTNGDASDLLVTRDGRYVFFRSNASNLVPNDPNGGGVSTFRHELATGVTTLIDIPASFIRISGDGRYLAYWSITMKLLDLQTGTTTEFLDATGSFHFDFSLDGRYVAFTSAFVEGTYETGPPAQVFVRDRSSGAYELISRRPDGAPGNGHNGDGIAISDDGRYVAFESLASDLVAGDTNGVTDVFVHDRVTGETTRVSLTAAGGERTTASGSPAISGDGAVVAFSSSAPPACVACPALGEIVVYDRNLSQVQVVSLATDGTPANYQGDAQGSVTAPALPIALSNAGRHVTFASQASNLVAGDTNRAQDVFLRDRGPVPGCTYQATPTVIDVGAAGGTRSVTVATTSGCAWAAAIADPWVSTSPASGSGPGTLSITIAGNSGVSRFGYLSIEGRRLLVRQSGALAAAPPAFEDVGLAPDGAEFPFGASPSGISADGRYVAYVGFVATGNSGRIGRMFLRDRVEARTIDVSGAPGGPALDPGVTHAAAGNLSPEHAVAFAGGVSLSADGRFVYFSSLLQCYLFDRTTMTTTMVPTSLGSSGSSCPSMSSDGRFFAGSPSTATINIFDRTTGQTSALTFPGVTFGQSIDGLLTSISGRYLLFRVSEYPNLCANLSCRVEESILLDRATGATARSGRRQGFFTPAQIRARQELVDPLWSEFSLHRFHARLDQTLAACQMVDRATGGRLPLPLLNTLTLNALDCGIAVNNGQQIIFGSNADLSPGDNYEFSTESHLYTIATGTASRLATRSTGDAYPMIIFAVSQNGRYAIAQTASAPYGGDPQVTTGVAVFDLGVVSSSGPVDGTAPTNLQVVVTGTTVSLSWTAPAQGTATSYVIDVGTAPGTSNLAQLETGTTATSLSAVAPLGTFYVRVRARISGALGSASNEVVVTVPGGCAAPAVPGGLTHSIVGASVTLSWQAAAGATRYLVDVGSASGLSNLFTFDTGAAATTLSASAPSGTYFVRVRARNACGTSEPSNETVVVVGGGCPTPAAPTGLAATVSGTTVSLSWGAPAGSVLGYVLDVGTSPGASNVGQFTLGVGTSLSAAAPAGNYYIRLRARNACGTGAASNEVVVTVTASEATPSLSTFRATSR